GSLPLKYLGLPLVPRRLSTFDCRCLTLRMVNKIHYWTSKCLSFSGRLQLIQATLTGILNFWVCNTVLPKSTLLECERIMRDYLWAGSMTRKQAKVAWAHVCKPKEEGGLGLRRSTECNNAALMKLLWEMLTNTFPLVTWKSLLRLRPRFATNLVYTIGHNSSWSLWHDPFQSKPLRDRLGDRVIYDSGLPIAATLSMVQQGNFWNWPEHVWQLRDISSACSNISFGQRDSIGWCRADGAFSYRAAWDLIRASSPVVTWAKVVWFSGAIPKHSFCLWLTFRKAHLTLDKLQAYGVVQQSLCPFGCGQQETIDHLFFNCSYTKSV
ncbi:LOW QUALITY PROTEIN: zf-RVT domain-containing protein, partial [Cephalotus follicularis]